MKYIITRGDMLKARFTRKYDKYGREGASVVLLRGAIRIPKGSALTVGAPDRGSVVACSEYGDVKITPERVGEFKGFSWDPESRFPNVTYPAVE